MMNDVFRIMEIFGKDSVFWVKGWWRKANVLRILLNGFAPFLVGGIGPNHYCFASKKSNALYISE